MKMRDRAVYLRSPLGSHLWLKLFKDGLVDEVYMDARGKGDEQLVREATELRRLLQTVPNLFEPIVFAPLTQLEPGVRAAFAEQIIRTSNLGFEDYCREIREPGVVTAGNGGMAM